MKLKTILFGFLLTVCGGCGDFLTTSPKSALSRDNYFQNKSDFTQAVNGAYAPLQNLYDALGSSAMAEMRSDNTHYFFNPDFRTPGPENIADFVNGSENTYTAERYYDDYDIIARANQVLAVIDNSDLEQAVKDNFKGQMLFLRAFAYFDLVRFYGGVPLYTKPAKNLETASLSRSSAEEVYTQIISDDSIAAKLLPNKDNQESGRATSGTAWTLLGKVYLTLEQWTDAEDALNNISESNYSLLENYSDVFNPSIKNNEESIFESQYSEGIASGQEASYFPYYYIPLTDNFSQLTKGPSSGSQSSSQSGWNIPTENLVFAYEDTSKDERFHASIGFYTGPSLISDTSYVDLPYVKKFQHSHSKFGQTNQNFPIYRYAEVLLMLSESINEQGRIAEATNYLNQVRNRAGLDNYAATDQADLRKAILHERRIEFAFENKRWLDLVRTGNAVDIMNRYGENLKSDPQYSYLSPNSYTVDSHDLLFPIPFREIQVNPDLDQNPGY